MKGIYIRIMIDILSIFIKKWCRPIPCANRVGIINNPKLRMSKRISMIISINNGNSCFSEFLKNRKIDFWSPKYISLKRNTHIYSSLMRIDNRFCQSSSISPCIYLNPNSFFRMINGRYKICTNRFIRQYINISRRSKRFLRWDNCTSVIFWMFTKKMCMVYICTSTTEKYTDEYIYFHE